MQVIYQPKGRAGEYADLAVNLYQGCTNGCVYCYAPTILRKDRTEFHLLAQPRENILKKLDKDAASIAGDPRNVLLCFTTDPYQGEDESLVSREAIRILNHYDIGVTILTKGGMLALRDFDLLYDNPKNRFGATLTFDHEKLSRMWEPNAASPRSRIAALGIAHDYGIKTWVSLEPIICPQTTMALIAMTAGFVDHYKVGKLNHHPQASRVDWPDCREKVIATLKQYGCDYMIKKDLLEAV